MAEGFFGGLSGGISDAQTQLLAQRKQEAEQEVRNKALAASQISETLKHIQDTAKALADAGNDPKSIQDAIAPLAASAAGLAEAAGYDPNIITQRVQLALMRPAVESEKKHTVVKIGQNPDFTDRYGVLEQTTGKLTDLNGVPLNSATGKPAAPTETQRTTFPPPPGTPPADVQAAAQPAVAQELPVATQPSARVAQAFGDVGAGPAAAVAAAAGPQPVSHQDTLDFKAEQLLGGNYNVLSGLGRSKAATAERTAIQTRAAEMAIQRNIKPDEVNAAVADFMGQKAAAVSIARRQATLESAINVASQTANRVIEASDKVNRTQYPTINSLIIAAQKGTGDENVIKLGVAVNTLINNYARAQGAGNAQLTDAARNEAHTLLQENYSKGQIVAAIQQMHAELDAELEGVKNTKSTVIGKSVSQAAKESKLRALGLQRLQTEVPPSRPTTSSGAVPPPPPGFILSR